MQHYMYLYTRPSKKKLGGIDPLVHPFFEGL